MNGTLIDHSPRQPDAVPPLLNASNVVLIDNYDSFTWNVFQYLVLEGANVKVFRNDEVSLKELIALQPTQLVVSPGPGNPEEDAGISKDAIRHFGGKIPVLGVCMGQQCIYTVFGGRVDVTGEILHGKTSPLRHDGKGMYVGLAQDLPVTRYHSLAGTHPTLPDSLEVTSWIEKGPDGGKGIIMGVRHKELLVEGVQFHPESILTEEGRVMLSNFLHFQGGTWKDNERLQKSGGEAKGARNKANEHVQQSSPATGTESSKPSILTEIFDRRKTLVEAQKRVPSLRPDDLQAYYDLNLSPPQIPFPDRLRQSPFTLSLMAEVKRASPSKGDIAPHICAPAQAKKYALAGASVISVLTEPEYFKGSIDDLKAVRQVLEGMPNRPAVLRKEFIFDEYQILEARLAGADTVLLIVKMLAQSQLERLYKYSQTLGMEPLVEVNTPEEMKTALELGSQVIGVNNRNLANFEVDLDTTSRLMDGVPESSVVCALSGISGPQDVEAYRKNGVRAVLVGEALMKAADIDVFVNGLLGGQDVKMQAPGEQDIKLKICGTRTAAAAKVAIEAGADMIGIILVEGRTRCVSHEAGLQISKVVHSTPKARSSNHVEKQDNTARALEHFDHTRSFLNREDRALLVGVFRNQPLSYILSQQRSLDLDIVQLHGSEPPEWASLISVPVIRRFGLGDPGLGLKGYHTLPLLDSALGGTGQSLDVVAVQNALKADPSLRVVLAGGLTPNNVGQTLSQLKHFSHQIVAVDVSSGVEESGAQDHEKIKSFIKSAKSESK
ncbi:MAG: anthranilate synthase / indole-3-glycerol phosphate synthase [Ramalina farinacea]|uniref:Multifunctional tryptophan biosynthesis protein n=1 Tax=Ramalina farinacea TaxID=258253 RepID=A0AA43TW09_9LECA|nr:anthranilate synthase / indole-3-glycerol phosphate synthase [Ramalina farinacea]